MFLIQAASLQPNGASIRQDKQTHEPLKQATLKTQICFWQVFKSKFASINGMGNVKEIDVKIDSEGRMCLPPAIRRQLGKHPTLKKTEEGYLLISSKQNDFLEEFRKLITSKHRRTGKPTLASPEEMKSIWDPTKRQSG